MELPVVVSSLELYISEINRFPILREDEEFQLAVRFRKHNDMEAAEKLVVSNLRFVVKIAHKYRSYGIALTDLIQEGNIGLLHAVKKFDPYKGHKLLSYAVWWIKAYIRNFIIRSWSLVKIGTTQTQRKLFFKLNEERKRLETISQKLPEFREIAESLGVREDEVEEMGLRLSQRDLSLDASLDGEDDSRTMIGYLPYQGEDQEMMLIKKEQGDLVKRDIAVVLAKLNERESYIIRHRVMADNPETLQEIGNHYNITRERARQLEKQALKKLRLALPHLGGEPELLEA
ncbi:MAG: RNA polymerase subunit sigma-70 [Syntrophaceae bacterium CG2_30_49_12]|nr:MAG: RNA polymerase subunit sigma-70 [Syntrophaceae bacterium CG2_30_49_12]PIP06120.1 MAG: RNA polymerase sigma factor RpoH [Syntrophobacterales bacterium CG23_combo_of_CG06-09_8_20_14_all_48_27]PJA49975.1 MAG: RNA polymerase sigma factor RpoH [Syntrophobacterales bacterium CG_4_9_14_3_um_filter_49_8]PJC75632.1 MAG: RNA polymerase sigma factor RpoH [Syntrophobacterales bacterium CG_4_8_14_3_um_filter_49_14]